MALILALSICRLTSETQEQMANYFAVYRLLTITFPPKPDGQTCRHTDGRTDGHYELLRY